MLPARPKPIRAVGDVLLIGDVLMIQVQNGWRQISLGDGQDLSLWPQHLRRKCGPARSEVRGLRALQGPTIRRRVAGLLRHATRLAIARRVAWPAVD